MSLFFLYEKLQCIEIDDSCGNGHERRVETVEHTAMSWQQCAAVLYSQSAFEETLYQVAPCSEEHDNQAQSHPSGNAESVSLAVICQVTNHGSCNQNEYTSAYASFPTLGRTDAWEEFMLAEERTAAVGSGIVCPKEYENTQWQQHVVVYLAVES